MRKRRGAHFVSARMSVMKSVTDVSLVHSISNGKAAEVEQALLSGKLSIFDVNRVGRR